MRTHKATYPLLSNHEALAINVSAFFIARSFHDGSSR